MDADGEYISAQELQAQIDLSMSFASSLAASWIKPSRSGANASSRRLELENQIWEAARRPSRLGVGTPVAQASQNTSREAVRLKGQLIGKRVRRDDDDGPKGVEEDEGDGDGESRARAIKKRTKVDPFELSSKKKKKQSLQVMVKGASSSAVASTTEKLSKTSLEDDLSRPGDNVQIPFKPFAANWDAPEVPAKAASPSGSGRAPLKQQIESSNLSTLHSLSPSEEATSTQEDHPKPTFLALVTPLSPSTKLPSELLKRPLLNLSDHSGSEEEAPATPFFSCPKKKRKRKKKKKKVATEGS